MSVQKDEAENGMRCRYCGKHKGRKRNFKSIRILEDHERNCKKRPEYVKGLVPYIAQPQLMVPAREVVVQAPVKIIEVELDSIVTRGDYSGQIKRIDGKRPERIGI